MVSADDEGLLGAYAPPSQSDGNGTHGTETPTKRKMLRRADYASTQIYQPHAPSSIEKATLEALWNVVSKGNKYTTYYSYLADCDGARQGVAISQFAQTMKHAITHFREKRVQHILKAEIYEKVKASADEIYPHLEVLDGGYQRKPERVDFLRWGVLEL